MKQTTKHQFNLIEKDDIFSPDSLNDNAVKTEAALEAAETARAALDAKTDALAGRVTLLEARKVAVGTYAGNGKGTNTPIGGNIISVTDVKQFVPLGFTPIAVLVYGGAYYSIMYTPTADSTPNGFTAAGAHNVQGYTYTYLAFA